MKPMSPLALADRWWSGELGDPSASGAQDGPRHAFFGHSDRTRWGAANISDRQASNHGISQLGGRDELAFTSEQGPVSVKDFEKVE